MTNEEWFMLGVAWVLCGFLALLVEARYQKHESKRLTVALAFVSGPIAYCVVFGAYFPRMSHHHHKWRDRYHATYGAPSE